MVKTEKEAVSLTLKKYLTKYGIFRMMNNAMRDLPDDE